MNESEKRRNSSVVHSFIELPGIDIGYKGGNFAQGSYRPAYKLKGIDFDTPGYDGKKLPFESESLMTVHVSHVLEHIDNYEEAIKEWFRVLKVGGHLLIFVPHQYLYEKKLNTPSKWNKEHKRFYTPTDLLFEIEQSLEPNSYRIVFCRDNDFGFDYSLGPDKHSNGCYEIECVIEKIKPPLWKIT